MTGEAAKGTTIKGMPADLRPRERLLSSGPQALSNAELLAILIRTGTRTETAIDVAQRLLSRPEGLQYLAAASLEELQKEKGIGLAKAAELKAALELGRRLAAFNLSRAAIKNPWDVAGLLMEEMRYLDRENFRTISLNTKNQVIGIDSVSVGSLNSSPAHPREVFKDPIRRSAAAIILVHNHPSGDPTPSQDDLAVTRRLVEAGQILGIEVLDHLIIGDGRFTSFKERNLL
ncbi:RadC family protein [Moorella sulfitireducens]|uniref:RadC family protein n=1 Tax=Neomoorella sulfitireducens TaxID=2972948 RepID=UPI0021AB9B3D|nr:DNA repair protein RadC [Moorella sulfitireducens]